MVKMEVLQSATVASRNKIQILDQLDHPVIATPIFIHLKFPLFPSHHHSWE